MARVYGLEVIYFSGYYTHTQCLYRDHLFVCVCGGDPHGVSCGGGKKKPSGE